MDRTNAELKNCPHCNAKPKFFVKARTDSPDLLRCGVCFKTWSAAELEPKPEEKALVLSLEDAEKRVVKILAEHLEADYRKALEAFSTDEQSVSGTATAASIIYEQQRRAFIEEQIGRQAHPAQELDIDYEAHDRGFGHIESASRLKIDGQQVIAFKRTPEGLILWTKNALYLL